MKSPYKNLFIDQGASFIETITVIDSANRPVNLNAYDVFASMKSAYNSDEVVDFEVTIIDYNKIQLYLSAEITRNMRPGRYIYDVIVRNDCEQIDRIRSGLAEVTPGVTLCQ